MILAMASITSTRNVLQKCLAGSVKIMQDLPGQIFKNLIRVFLQGLEKFLQESNKILQELSK